jgi:hypothetical protein
MVYHEGSDFFLALGPPEYLRQGRFRLPWHQTVFPAPPLWGRRVRDHLPRSRRTNTKLNLAVAIATTLASLSLPGARLAQPASSAA